MTLWTAGDNDMQMEGGGEDDNEDVLGDISQQEENKVEVPAETEPEKAEPKIGSKEHKEQKQ